MSGPTFIRFFCETTGYPGPSELAWSFMRRLIRFRPVLVASLTGFQMGGRWVGYETLRTTPQLGSFVNVVCAAPERWTWLSRVAAPTTQLTPSQLAAGDESTTEMITARQELWTAGVRNVLIAPAAPRTQPEIETARKYDMIIVPDLTIGSGFAHAAPNLETWVCAHPYPEQTVRNLVLGDDA